MNYITHLNQWMELVAVDDRLTPGHISIYLALFQLWNKSRFPDQLAVCRNEVLGISKIGSSRTYYKCLHDLHDYGYIRYQPSYNPLKGSVIEINELGDADLSGEHETDDETAPKMTRISAKKNLIPEAATRVRPGQNQQGTCGKNDTGPAHVVTPLFINTINKLNSKHRERRAREKKMKDEFSNKKMEQKKEERAAGERKKTAPHPGATAPAHVTSARRMESSIKKEVPRDFLIPTPEQVKDFFLNQLTGNFENNVLDEKTRALEATKFFYHYEANGWLLGGKVPMRNWKASCRSWVAKMPYFNRQERKRSSFDRLNAKAVLNYGTKL